MQRVLNLMEIENSEDIKAHKIKGKMEHNGKQVLLILNEQYKAAKLELQGLFTTNEAWLIVHALNGVTYSPEQSAKFILNEFVENYTHFGFNKDLDIDGSLLLCKLDKLTEFQAYTALKMVCEFLEIDLDEESDHDCEELLDEIFMVSNKEIIINDDEVCSKEICDCEENPQNLELCLELGFEKLRHIGTILALNHGIFIAIGFDEGEFSLFEDCDDCRELHHLESYTTNEVIELDVVGEANYLIESYFID